LVTYWPVTHCGFVNFDDDIYVYENPVVKDGLSWKGIQWAFSTASLIKGAIVMWHPITWMSLMLDDELFGLDPSFYHLINLLFHIITGLLLFTILYRMTRSTWQSAIVAGLFAIHPIHVESVAWISERKDVISAMLWMLTTVAYIRYVEQPKALRYVLAIILFTIGLMAKPMLITLPFVLLLLDYWPLARFDTVQVRRLVIEKIPLFILSLIFSIIGYVSQKSGGVLNLVSVPVVTCIENALRSYIIYLQKLFWPADLAVLYPIHHPFVIPFWQISGSLLILAGVTIFALWIRKKHPYLLVGWFWYLGTLLPVIGIFQLGHQAYADRYTYIPLIGIFVMIAWGMTDLVRRIPFHRVITAIGVIVIFIILAIVTQNQIGYWQNTTSLMTHAIEMHPENYMAHWYLGTYQKSNGQPAEAIANFEEALKIDPWFNIYHELAKMLWQQGRFNEALSYLTTCSNLDPENAQTYNDMGIILMSMHRKEQAISYFNKAIQIDPNYNIAINNLNRALSSRQ
jgi:hypothetical protein